MMGFKNSVDLRFPSVSQNETWLSTVSLCTVPILNHCLE